MTVTSVDVDGDRLLVLAQKTIIDIAKRHMEGVNPLYYEMKKAKAEMLTKENIYEGLRLAFTGGNIGAISNDITKIWNQENITKEELLAVRWLCMETNFTIDYAKTLFKPERPEYVNEILKKFHSMDLPYFFMYAKDKEKESLDKINNSTLNRIVKEIRDVSLMFNTIKDMDKINYKLLTNGEEYFNEEINDIYNSFNKNYGENLKIDEENNDKNNVIEITKELKKKFYEIEKDDNKIVNSLVKSLYSKNSSKKKKLLWFAYGDIMYNNLLNNIDKNTDVCMQCGKRTPTTDLVRHKCLECRSKELTSLNGHKLIKCVDCGKEFEVIAKNTKTCRCEKCQALVLRKYEREKKRKQREK